MFSRGPSASTPGPRSRSTTGGPSAEAIEAAVRGLEQAQRDVDAMIATLDEIAALLRGAATTQAPTTAPSPATEAAGLRRRVPADRTP